MYTNEEAVWKLPEQFYDPNDPDQKNEDIEEFKSDSPVKYATFLSKENYFVGLRVSTLNS